jgi:hypothetical protein
VFALCLVPEAKSEMNPGLKINFMFYRNTGKSYMLYIKYTIPTFKS